MGRQILIEACFYYPLRPSTGFDLILHQEGLGAQSIRSRQSAHSNSLTEKARRLAVFFYAIVPGMKEHLRTSNHPGKPRQSLVAHYNHVVSRSNEPWESHSHGIEFRERDAAKGIERMLNTPGGERIRDAIRSAMASRIDAQTGIFATYLRGDAAQTAFGPTPRSLVGKAETKISSSLNRLKNLAHRPARKFSFSVRVGRSLTNHRLARDARQPTLSAERVELTPPAVVPSNSSIPVPTGPKAGRVRPTPPAALPSGSRIPLPTGPKAWRVRQTPPAVFPSGSGIPSGPKAETAGRAPRVEQTPPVAAPSGSRPPSGPKAEANIWRDLFTLAEKSRGASPPYQHGCVDECYSYHLIESAVGIIENDEALSLVLGLTDSHSEGNASAHKMTRYSADKVVKATEGSASGSGYDYLKSRLFYGEEDEEAPMKKIKVDVQ